MKNKLLKTTYLLCLILLFIPTVFILQNCTVVPADNGGDDTDIPVVDLNFKVYNAHNELLGTLNDLVPDFVAPVSTPDQTRPMKSKIDDSKSFIGLAIADNDSPTWTYVLVNIPYNPISMDAEDKDKYGTIWAGLEMGRTTSGAEIFSSRDWVLLTKPVTTSPSYNLMINENQKDTKIKCLLAGSTNIIDLKENNGTEGKITIGFTNTAEYGDLLLLYPNTWYKDGATPEIDSELSDENGTIINQNAYLAYGFADYINLTGDKNPNGIYTGCINIARKFGTLRKENGVEPDLAARMERRKQLLFPITIKNETDGEEAKDIVTINLNDMYDDSTNGFEAVKQKLTDAGFIFPKNSLTEK